MKDYTIDKTGKKEDIPSWGQVRRDYQPILKSAATLKKGEFVKVDSPGGKELSAPLKKKLKEMFPSTKFNITQRSYKDSKKISFYIVRES